MSFGNVMCSEIAMAVETMTAVAGALRVAISVAPRVWRYAWRPVSGLAALALGCLADDLDNRDLPLFDRLRAAVEAIIDRRSPRTSYLLTPKQEISGLISCDSSFRPAINWLSANTSLEVRKGGISASA
jgi:hypothetical protein